MHMDRQKKNNIRSCLDITKASTALAPYVVNDEVDRERKYTPRRVIKKRDMITKIFTDQRGGPSILSRKLGLLKNPESRKRSS